MNHTDCIASKGKKWFQQVILACNFVIVENIQYTWMKNLIYKMARIQYSTATAIISAQSKNKKLIKTLR